MAEVNGASTASPSQQPAPIPQPQAPTPPPAAATASNEASANANVEPLPQHPATSSIDSGTGTRPRDARTIHMILSAMGVQAYQERVPLQLLDFSYRYTAGVLSDAQHLTVEGYGPGTTGGGGRGGANSEEIGTHAVRLAASSRPSFQFTGSQLSKDTLLEMAAERNKIRLPAVDPQGPKFGLRLPHERFLLNGRGWNLKDQWDSEEEESEELAKPVDTNDLTAGADVNMADGEAGEEDGEPTMEDVFGNEEENEDSRMDEE